MTGHSTRRRAAMRDVLLIALALALLGVAGFLYMRGGSESDIPDTAESAVDFVCRECGKFFRLTPLEIHHAMNNHERPTAVRGGEVLFPCKHCGKWAGERTPEDDEAPTAPQP